jgi:hypothetical protein
MTTVYTEERAELIGELLAEAFRGSLLFGTRLSELTAKAQAGLSENDFTHYCNILQFRLQSEAREALRPEPPARRPSRWHSLRKQLSLAYHRLR